MTAEPLTDAELAVLDALHEGAERWPTATHMWRLWTAYPGLRARIEAERERAATEQDYVAEEQAARRSIEKQRDHEQTRADDANEACEMAKQSCSAWAARAVAAEERAERWALEESKATNYNIVLESRLQGAEQNEQAAVQRAEAADKIALGDNEALQEEVARREAAESREKALREELKALKPYRQCSASYPDRLGGTSFCIRDDGHSGQHRNAANHWPKARALSERAKEELGRPLDG